MKIQEKNMQNKESEIQKKYREYKYSQKGNIIITILIMIVILYFQSLDTNSILNAKGTTVAHGILLGIFNPDRNILFTTSKNGVPFLILQTISIAISGTIIGTLLAIPLGFLSNTKIVPTPIAYFFNAVTMFIRTIPTLIWALMWIRVTGPGSFCGVITQSVCSIGMISRMYSNAIDDLNTQLIESLDSMGFTRFQKLRYGILPQLSANFISTSIYRFDINLKDAATLGIVGAGGIGATLIQSLSTARWNMAGSFILGFVILIILIEYLSTWIRKKL